MASSSKRSKTSLKNPQGRSLTLRNLLLQPPQVLPQQENEKISAQGEPLNLLQHQQVLPPPQKESEKISTQGILQNPIQHQQVSPPLQRENKDEKIPVISIRDSEVEDDLFRYFESITPTTAVPPMQYGGKNLQLLDASSQGNQLPSSALQHFRDYNVPWLREILVNEQNRVAHLTEVLTGTSRNLEKIQGNIRNIEVLK